MGKRVFASNWEGNSRVSKWLATSDGEAIKDYFTLETFFDVMGVVGDAAYFTKIIGFTCWKPLLRR